jgi:hypothetical protein
MQPGHHRTLHGLLVWLVSREFRTTGHSQPALILAARGLYIPAVKQAGCTPSGNLIALKSTSSNRVALYKITYSKIPNDGQDIQPALNSLSDHSNIYNLDRPKSITAYALRGIKKNGNSRGEGEDFQKNYLTLS